MSAAEYPVATMQQMARIPEEALPRFLAELPEIIAETRRLLVIADVMKREHGMNLTPGEPKWVDDDARTVTTTVEFPDGSTIEAGRKMSGVSA